MREVRAIQLLKSLNKSEITRLKLFLNSPYHTQQEVFLQLVEVLLKLPTEKLKKLDQLTLYDKLFDDRNKQKEAYCRKKILKMISGLALQIESFIVCEQVQNDAVQKQEYLTSFLSKRGGVKAFEQSRKKWENLIRDQKDAFLRYVNGYRINKMHFESLHTDRHNPGESDAYLERMDQQAYRAYWTARLFYLCSKTFRCLILEQDHIPQNDITEALQKTEDLVEGPAACSNIRMLRKLIVTGSNPGSLDLYTSTVGYFQRTFKQFSPEDRNAFCYFLLTYCYNGNSRGIDDFLPLSFELAEWSQGQGITSPDQELSEASFMNTAITQIAVHNKVAIIDQYITTYLPMVPAEVQPDAESMVRAYLAFHQKQYETARDWINKIDRPEAMYVTRKCSLQIRIIYHLFTQRCYRLDATLASIESFQKKFSSTGLKLAAEKKDSYLLLAWFIKRMLTFHIPNSQNTADLLQQLEDKLYYQPLPCRDWVRAQLNDIRAKITTSESIEKNNELVRID